MRSMFRNTLQPWEEMGACVSQAAVYKKAGRASACLGRSADSNKLYWASHAWPIIISGAALEGSTSP